jgi:hypothetical protein
LGLIEFGEDCTRSRFGIRHDVARLSKGRSALH